MNTFLFQSIKYDCRFFDGAKPCKPHKNTGVFCDACEFYSPIKEKILVIKFAAAGDVLRTTSILPAIKREYPSSAIFWITAPNAVQIFENNPLVDKVYCDSGEYLPLLQTINFDVVYNLESDKNSASLATICSAPVKYGYLLSQHGFVYPANALSKEWFLMGVNDSFKKSNTKTYFEHMYFYSDLSGPVAPPELYLSSKEIAITEEFKDINKLNKYKRVIGINTGSGKRWPLKKWGFDSYVALCEKLHKENPELGIVLFGGPEEVDFNNKLISSLSFPIIDAGCTNSLRKFFALVNATDVFLTPDSLAMHAAIALKKKTLVYVGPTSYTELDVFGAGNIIHSDIDCLMCYLNECDKPINCMNTIPVERIYLELLFLCEA